MGYTTFLKCSQRVSDRVLPIRIQRLTCKTCAVRQTPIDILPGPDNFLLKIEMILRVTL